MRNRAAQILQKTNTRKREQGAYGKRCSKKALPYTEKRRKERAQDAHTSTKSTRFKAQDSSFKTAAKEANQTLWEKLDRNRRRHDGNHGPLSKLQPHHHTNRTRTLQIPHQVFFASEDSKGIFLPLYTFLSRPFSSLPFVLPSLSIR